VVDRYAYGVWGSLVSSSEAVPQRLRYAGYWYDQELNWYWVGVRYYSPSLKRWLQPDPSMQDGVRTYVYVGDDPVDRTDPTGLASGAPPPTRTPTPVGTPVPFHCYAGTAFACSTPPTVDLHYVFVTCKLPGLPRGAYLASPRGIIAWCARIYTGAFGSVWQGRLYVSQKGIDTIKAHLERLDVIKDQVNDPNGAVNAPYNRMQLDRLQAALDDGSPISGGDANFYLHELAESTLMDKGLSYEEAHWEAMQRYGFTSLAQDYYLYAREVVKANIEYWNRLILPDEFFIE